MVLLKGTRERKTTTGQHDTLTNTEPHTKYFNSTKTINTFILGASDFLFPVALEKIIQNEALLIKNRTIF